MSGTDPLTGARYPTSGDAPQVYQDIKNAVNDLSDKGNPTFATTTARDTAYSAWVAAGHSMRPDLLCSVTGAGRYRYNGSIWHPDRGLMAAASATTQWTAASGGAEQRITTLILTGQQLRSGTLYKVRLKCRAWPSAAGNVFSLRIRSSSTGIPTATSDAIAARQVGNPPGSTEASDYVVEDDFVVQTSNTYSIAPFGIIATGTMAVAADGRGRYELMLYDLGPAPSGMNTVTT